MSIALSALLGFLGAGLGIAQIAQNVGVTQSNNKRAEENYNLQKNSFNENLALQKEAFQFQKDSYLNNFEYQKNLQQQLFAREDNAVQRRVADLQKAGLSKTLAAGDGAGAGSVVSTSPSSASFSGSPFSGKAPVLSGVDLVSTALSLADAQASIRKTNAEAENLLKQNQKMDSDMLVNDAQVSYIKAKTAVEEGNLGILSLTGQQIQTSIDYTKGLMRKVDAEIQSIQQGVRMNDWKLKYFYPEDLKIKIQELVNLRREGKFKDAQIAYYNLQTDVLTETLAGKELENKILSLDYNYQQSTGFKPRSASPFIGDVASTLSTDGYKQYWKFLGDNFDRFVNGYKDIIASFSK